MEDVLVIVNVSNPVHSLLILFDNIPLVYRVDPLVLISPQSILLNGNDRDGLKFPRDFFGLKVYMYYLQ